MRTRAGTDDCRRLTAEGICREVDAPTLIMQCSGTDALPKQLTCEQESLNVPEPAVHRHALQRPQSTPRTGAGRPTAERVEAIEHAILEAAREHFLAAGFELTAMEAIAATAHVSKSTLYARYPTKAALLRAVVEKQVASWSAEQHRRRGPLPEDFKQRLQCHARAILESLASEEVRAFQKLLRRTGAPDSELARILFDVSYGPSIQDLADEIVRGTHDFPVPPRSPTRVAEMLMTMLYGWNAAREVAGHPTPDEAITYADHAVDVIFAGRAAW